MSGKPLVLPKPKNLVFSCELPLILRVIFEGSLRSGRYRLRLVQLWQYQQLQKLSYDSRTEFKWVFSLGRFEEEGKLKYSIIDSAAAAAKRRSAIDSGNRMWRESSVGARFSKGFQKRIKLKSWNSLGSSSAFSDRAPASVTMQQLRKDLFIGGWTETTEMTLHFQAWR